MNILDLAVLTLGSAIIMMIFVTKTNIEKSRVRVKIKSNK